MDGYRHRERQEIIFYVYLKPMFQKTFCCNYSDSENYPQTFYSYLLVYLQKGLDIYKIKLI